MKGKYLVLPIITFFLTAGLGVYAYFHRAELLLLNPQGAVGFSERWVILMTFFLSGIVVIPVFILLFIFAWKYRAGHININEKHAPNWDHDNWVAEAIWWFVPVVIVTILSYIAWTSTHQLDPFSELPSQNPQMTINVVALDWKWLFIYPDLGIASVNHVVFPEDTPIQFVITADAPMNAFWIPSLGGQIMAMPGMETKVNLIADSKGEYRGASSNISGKGFSGMEFTASAVGKEEFDSWVVSIHQQSSPLSEVVYTELAKPSERNPRAYFYPVDTELYTKILMKYMSVDARETPTTEEKKDVPHMMHYDGMIMPPTP